MNFFNLRHPTEEGHKVLHGACMYLFEFYGGPFNMQKNPGDAILILSGLMSQVTKCK